MFVAECHVQWNDTRNYLGLDQWNGIESSTEHDKMTDRFEWTREHVHNVIPLISGHVSNVHQHLQYNTIIYNKINKKILLYVKMKKNFKCQSH